ncbi:gliding motility-associated C-terminal domain-containing protein [Joostella atrarenae]|uniref:Gliding motility-associated C-terminal domain-containing protein n=1 Tax=Joostella atrarenae TaxID=679257 RepID=A0ABS9J7P9_9FLAO|nr:gliding motility-associated C-terminal domain-containing protein [Joostella atrarenae]MCF8716451.1 gliding motility-associated C-terminal domain-containing protein [Joostella atrarenae]
MYKINIKHDVVFMFFILFSSIGICQTTNEGNLSISKGTLFSNVSDFHNNGVYYNDGSSYFYGNFTNDGEIDYLDESSKILFTGSDIQTIGGNQVIFVKNIDFVNTSEGQLYNLIGELNIDGEANFKNGIIKSDDNLGFFRLGRESSVINNSNRSFVDGYVYVDDNVSYHSLPTGNLNYYSPIAYENSNSIEINTVGKYYRDNPTDIYGGLTSVKEGTILQTINTEEYWEFSNNSQSEDSGYYITLPINGSNNSLFDENPEGIRILWWDENDQSWESYSSLVDTNSMTVTALVPQNGIFTLGLMEGQDLPCGGMEIYNAVTPNSDGKNDFFKISFKEGDVCPYLSSSIHVEIFNRWGVKVFETDNYGSNTGEDVFTGLSEGRATLVADDGLPSGTYYYIIKFVYDAGFGTLRQYDKAGYLYVSDN